MQGVDISNWQAGCIPSNLPVDFCIVKATEGIGFTDPTCEGFVSNCRDNGILWGFYHFARENEPEDEAQYFYDECWGYFNQGIPVLDYETSNYNNCEWCERFLSKLHELTGIWAMLYISASRCGEYENSWIADNCGLWVAGYPWDMDSFEQAGNMPYNIYPWSFAAIWQFTSGLHLPGYDGRLDGNIGYLDADAWMKYAGSSEPAPKPTPAPTPEPPEKTIDDYVREVLAGAYGNDQERIDALGAMYQPVQDRINELYRIADEVINGDWGNGWNRENALTGAGYPYDIVQGIVNSILA